MHGPSQPFVVAVTVILSMPSSVEPVRNGALKVPVSSVAKGYWPEGPDTERRPESTEIVSVCGDESVVPVFVFVIVASVSTSLSIDPSTTNILARPAHPAHLEIEKIP